ncbi:asparaginase [Amycolatopsis nigrescens]|uniref:asparaginase n=1 Tax=Amycolatopsis nigrescens TaxID=381445 RepID=UPI0003653638|nr:asparaginase [Amycolatopsis nigrescens]
MSRAAIRVPAHEPLVQLWRDGMVESVHHGSVVVLRRDGTTLFQAGDPDAAFYPRSAAKPLQAVAMTRLGLDLPPELLALAAASHSGEEFHLAGAAKILDLAGLGEAQLRNPEDLPFDPVERDLWVASGRTARKLAHNCSGKHAAMLVTSHRLGWSLVDYLDPGHPLQRAIADTFEELSGESVARVATDGCGAPLFSFSLRGLATAAGRIAAATGTTAESRVAQAIRRHPEMLGGSRRDVTRLITAVPGLIAKDGFESVQVAALPDGTAIAIKIADGTDRARPPALAAALALCGVDPDVLAPFAGTAGPDGLRVTGALAEGLRPVPEARPA